MYAKIVYNPDALNTPTLILGHLIDLLTGTEVIGSLTGGNIDTGACEIDASFESAAFTLYDDISATRKVLEVAVHDDATSKFYFELLVSSNDIDMKLWESWNAVTHVGTGGAYYTTTGFEFVSLTGYATSTTYIYLSVSATHCIARSVYSSGLVKYFRGFMQYERGEAWDTVANGSKPAVVTYVDNMFKNATQVYALPHIRSDSYSYSYNLAILYATTNYGSSQLDAFSLLLGNSASNARGLDASEVSVHNMYEFGFGYLSSGERFSTGRVPNMYLATYGHGAFGDTVTIDGNLHFIWESDANYRVAIRKG